MKKLKIVFVCVVISIIGLFYYFSIDYQRIRGFIKFPENSVQGYVYERGCMAEKENYTQIDPSDYETLLQIVSQIQYMNPNIDPLSIKYTVYGGGSYEFDIVSENAVTTFGISCNELEPNIRRVTLSDGRIERYISAYVNNDLYQEYKSLAKKYMKESKNSEIQS
ncbi:MAG TPA: hypothetical protein DDW34_03145 [Clostridium sp.]|nr:hypothetical protein [Clostridium sp.]